MVSETTRGEVSLKRLEIGEPQVVGIPDDAVIAKMQGSNMAKHRAILWKQLKWKRVQMYNLTGEDKVESSYHLRIKQTDWIEAVIRLCNRAAGYQC